MNNPALRELLLTAAKEKDGQIRLPCAEAFRIAHQNNISLAEIGSICDTENIRICKCQLGCFK